MLDDANSFEACVEDIFVRRDVRFCHKSLNVIQKAAKERVEMLSQTPQWLGVTYKPLESWGLKRRFRKRSLT